MSPAFINAVATMIITNVVKALDDEKVKGMIQAEMKADR